MPKPDPVLSLVDEQAVAEVWVSTPEETAGWKSECFLTRPPDFFFVSKDGQERGNRKLRRTITADDIGLVKKEIIVDGKKRYWYVYEPSRIQKGQDAEAADGDRIARIVRNRGVLGAEHRVASCGGSQRFYYGIPNGVHAYIRSVYVRDTCVVGIGDAAA